MEKRSVINYTNADGVEKIIGKFGHSTQQEFDEAIESLPKLIAMARNGNEKCGYEANALLWHLANESTNTKEHKGLETHHTFGRKA
ncbi:MAG: hypothetical protein FWB95_02770 [Treponema sp.]|nr:hypothetical protein [Treponema sp.]